MPETPGVLSWCVEEIGRALHIEMSEVREYFTDGRRVSFLLERRIAREVLGGSVAASEGASFDILDPNGGKWEVRSISRGGIYFCPSYMVGSGRKFEEAGFLKKLGELSGFIVADIESFPDVPYWILPVDYVATCWRRGQLGKSSAISRVKALALLGMKPQ